MRSHDNRQHVVLDVAAFVGATRRTPCAFVCLCVPLFVCAAAAAAAADYMAFVGLALLRYRFPPPIQMEAKHATLCWLLVVDSVPGLV